MWQKVSLFLVLHLMGNLWLFGQSASALQSQLDDALAQGQTGTALAITGRLMQIDSTLVLERSQALASLVLKSPDPRPGALDTLALIYDLGIRKAPEGADNFRQRKALLGFRFPDHFAEQRRDWLREAIQADPFRCRLQLYRFWAEDLGVKPIRRAAKLVALAQDWSQFNRWLYARELLNPPKGRSIFLVRQELHRQVRALSPSCSDLEKLLRPAVIPNDRFTALTFLDLHQCRNHPFWALIQQDSPDFLSGWSLRLLALHALDSGDLEASLSGLDRAIAAEELPILKADLYATRAQLYLQQENYLGAKRELQAAIRVAPTWGELYLQLADVYLQGSEACNFNDFDQKAVYWLAIDLAQKAINTSPHLENEAYRRIFHYRKRMPEPDEVRFRGLKAGDTWPLKCWMSTVTTVKVD